MSNKCYTLAAALAYSIRVTHTLCDGSHRAGYDSDISLSAPRSKCAALDGLIFAMEPGYYRNMNVSVCVGEARRY